MIGFELAFARLCYRAIGSTLRRTVGVGMAAGLAIGLLSSPGRAQCVPADAVTDGSATSYCGTVYLTWSPRSGETEFGVYRSTVADPATALLAGVVIAAEPPTQTGFVDSSLSPGQSLFYWVMTGMACNPAAGMLPVQVVVRGAATPPTLSLLTIGGCPDELRLHLDGVVPSTQYRVFRSEARAGATGLEIRRLTANSAASIDISDRPPPGVNSRYWVVAETACDSRATPGFVEGFVAQPPPVTALTALPLNSQCSQTGVLSWPAVRGAVSYSILQSTDVSPDAVVVGTAGGSLTTFSTGLLPSNAAYADYSVGARSACGTPGVVGPVVRMYRTPPAFAGAPSAVRVRCGVTQLTWQPAANTQGSSVTILRGTTPVVGQATTIGSTTIDAAQFTDNATPAGDVYYWLTAAFCGGRTVAVTPLPDPTPAAPTGLAAQPYGGSCPAQAVRVSWAYPATLQNAFDVYRGTSDDPAESVLVGSTVGSSFVDFLAGPTAVYSYWVRAHPACGPLSSLAGPVHGSRTTQPPQNLSASYGTVCRAVTLSWDAVAGATGYDVLYTTQSSGVPTIVAGSTPATTFADIGRASGAPVRYAVRAQTPCGTTAISDVVSGLAEDRTVQGPSVRFSVTACGTVQLTWDAPCCLGASTPVYVVTRNDPAGPTLIGQTTGLSIEDTDPPGTFPQYSVVSRTACGDSTARTIYASLSSSRPVRPAEFGASAGTYCGGVRLNWAFSTAPSSSTTMTILRGTSADPASATVLSSVSSTQQAWYDDGQATQLPGQRFYYWLLPGGQSAVTACPSLLTGPVSGWFGVAVTPASAGVFAPPGTTAVLGAQTVQAPVGVQSVQWKRAGTNLVESSRLIGTRTRTLSILGVLPGDADQYQLVITPPCGAPTTTGFSLLVPVACSIADITGIGGPPSVPDGVLTGDDFNAFISAFAAGDLLADVTGIGGPPSPRDGLVTGDDFNAFIAAFAAGCQ